MLRPMLISLAILLTATAATARDPSSQLCDMRLLAEVTLSGDEVIVDDGDRRHVLDADRVLRDGRRLRLEDDRRRLARDYADGMRELVPAVSEIALRGALLGLESLALVSAGLSGDEATTVRAAERIETLATELHLRFDGRRLPVGPLPLDPAFEREIGALAADAAGQFAGSVIAFIGTALFDPDAAGARGEYLERLVERRIEPRAARIEAQADQLCGTLRRLDAIEAELGLFDVIVDARNDRAI
ncbi:DUF2884 family protein [Sinimarinibacterium flocculans]|uniref:DUF2884 family protein n=1 Tax=Sinimarinibacterium flocculans TaxID=985250 RepID=A0A318EHX8_9GAMM|nr:DUF2884 family protein [Sinimarinibacterium flocculans]PXV70389.1 hypothetical protein C8D93_102241 [Sinimarinibacterium flocculans]